jgi:signal peptidase I
MRRLRWLVLALALALAIRQWVWMPAFVIGESMKPTLRHGQWAGVNKLTYRFRPPRRGDIILVKSRLEVHAKRIVGLPGEEIAMRFGVVYVNGRPLAEPYVRLRGGATIAAGRLGADRFLVAGDNRPESIIAVVRRERIVGRLVSWHADLKPILPALPHEYHTGTAP